MENLQNKIWLKFKNQDLYTVAFTHRSFINENKNATEHNERMEFLWDAVLELSVTQFLFQEFPDQPEWRLTNLRSFLVKRETLAKTALDIWLWKLLLLSRGEEMSGWRDNFYLLANTVESLIWAIFLDQGFEKANKFILEFIVPKLEWALEWKEIVDSKSRLQAYTQAKLKVTPKYQVLFESWPDHDKNFIIWAYCLDCCLWVWNGSKKQAAQLKAAENACKKFWLN